MNILYKGSSLIYFCLYRLIGYRKQVAVQNISRAFPEKRYEEIDSIVQDFYRNFTDYFAEVLKNTSTSMNDVNEKLTLEDFEYITEQIGHGRSVIACLGHCANWEILNCVPTRLSITAYTGYKPIKAPIINQLMIDIRKRFGVGLVPSKSLARHILSNRDNPSLYFLIADQSPKIANSKYVFPFLNQQTSVYPGMEKLAKATNSVVVYIDLVRIKRGFFHALCIPICENPGEHAELEITRKYMYYLEKTINEHPSSWLWTHKRWKR
jgi:KDO2-lipid IV(A) lauroyltransferase